MANFRSEPYLWLHLAGLAAVPLTLQGVWLGLGVGNPFPAYWIELAFLGAIGILPILWMQWSRPFDFFSVLFLSLNPYQLTIDRLRTLSRLKTPKQRALALGAAIVTSAIAWEVYQLAPFASGAVTFLPQWRLLGLAIAGVCLLLTHLFIQVPVSVMGILLTSEEQWVATEVFSSQAIAENFLVPGIAVNQIPLLPTEEP